MNSVIFVGIVVALITLGNRRLKTLTLNLEQRIRKMENDKP